MNTIRIVLMFVLLTATHANAQTNDTEFTKGWQLNLKLTNGAVTNFKGNTADWYAGGLFLNPQVTAIPGVLRLGANAGAVYTGKKFSGLFGPMVALKLKTFATPNFGSLANLHLIAEASWGTHQQQIAGGGLGFEILQLAHIGLTAQRDYKLNNWWLQSFIAIRLNKMKHTEDEYSR